MKISQIIKQLENIKKDHGDLYVMTAEDGKTREWGGENMIVKVTRFKGSCEFNSHKVDFDRAFLHVKRPSSNMQRKMSVKTLNTETS